MKAEIVLHHRKLNEVSLYQFQMDVKLDVFIDWIANSVSPTTLNQYYYGDKPTCKPAEDIVVIAVRSEFGELFRRSEEEIQNVSFCKGTWS